MRPRSPLIAGLLVLLLAGAALALYWVWAADRLARGIAGWTERQRALGYDIAYGGPEVGGFPVKLTARLAAPRIAAPQGWRWSGSEITGEAALWAPRTIHLTLPRRQSMSADWQGRRRRLTLDAEAARGLVRLGRGGRIKALVLEAAGLSLRDGAGRTLRAAAARFGLTRRPPAVAGTGDRSLLLAGASSGVTLPEGTGSPLGDTIERLAFDATLLGAVPPGRPAESLARWRDAGGTLEVHALELRWGPLTLMADGTATLDRALRPEAAFTARLAGLPRTIDALADRGLIESGEALGIKVMLLALPGTKDETGAKLIELPITLQDGLLYLGPAPLFRISPVL
ncbi:MAG: DUF2125 domain-containing protein [Kiloniellaceae bacterium]